MLYQPFKTWWCCLNPRERTALQLLVIAYFSNEEYITESAYTVIAFMSGLASSILMDEYFISHYGLTAGIIIDEEELPVSVFFFDTTFWPAMLEFSLTDEFVCLAPCKLLTFPN